MRIRFCFIILLSLYGTALQAQEHALYADSLRKSNRIPELAYAVVTGNKVLEVSISGHHRVDAADTATLNDRFHIGSNTKAMTAFMIARYVEKGKLSWTTKFFDLFPEWKTKSRPAYYGITLQDLLSHRAGIRDLGEEGDPVLPVFKGSHQQQRNAFAQFVLTLDPVFPDSTHPFIYSNSGYTLAALMVEKTAGLSWEQLTEKIFNKELKLHVQLYWPENQRRNDTWGHYENETGKLVPVPSDTTLRLDYTEPAGDFNMRIADYCRFIQFYLHGLAGKNHYLRSETYRYMLTAFPGYALGWYNVSENGKSWSTHSGTVGTYFAQVQIDRQQQIAYIVFANSYSEHTTNGVRFLMRKLKAAYGH